MSNDLTKAATIGVSEELTKSRAALELLKRFENDVLLEGNILTLGVLPSKADKQALYDRATAVGRSLTPSSYSIASRERAAGAVTAMFRDGWPLHKIEIPKQVIAGYLAALSDHPVWAIEMVCSHYARGLIVGENPNFPPSAAAIARQCENKTVDMREEKARFIRILAIKDIRKPQMTDEELAGVRARHEAWKLKNLIEPDPISEEERRRREEASRQAIAASRMDIIASYRAMGRKPHYASDGTLVSPSLLKSVDINPKTVQPAQAVADMDKP